MTSESDAAPRSHISNRMPIPQLRERLELLFRHQRHVRIGKVTELDRELGLSGERSFRQCYRKDRVNGIPGDLLEPFLGLFRLRLEELRLPLEDFTRLLESTSAQGRPPIGWYGAEASSPPLEVTRIAPGDVRFTWPDLGVCVTFVSEQQSAPLAAPQESVTLLNLRRREASKAFVLLQREFRIEVQLPENKYRRVMGLIEGSQLSCFHPPYELQRTKLRLHIPQDGDPYYFDEVGRHSLWILLFGSVRISSSEIHELDSDDARTRRSGAERIFNAARNEAPESVVVLRADFDVVT
jgi:hypothetical protein